MTQAVKRPNSGGPKFPDTTYVVLDGGYEARYCPNNPDGPTFEIAVGGNKGGTRHFIEISVPALVAMLQQLGDDELDSAATLVLDELMERVLIEEGEPWVGDCIICPAPDHATEPATCACEAFGTACDEDAGSSGDLCDACRDYCEPAR